MTFLNIPTYYKDTARIEQLELNIKYARNYLILKKNTEILQSQKVYDLLRPLATVFAKFYRLPKIYKPDVPFIASQGSPTYKLAKYLAEIFKPLFGKSEHHVVNSKEFVTKIEQTKFY